MTFSVNKKPRAVLSVPSSSGSSVKELVKAKLASSGLDESDAKRLGFIGLSPQEVAALDPCFRARPGLMIPYKDPITGNPLRTRSGLPEFYRLRYLGDPPPSFSDQTGEKSPRYVQPSDTGVAAYFPPGPDWKTILKTHEEPLVITEGELKAAKAAKEGFPCIGLGGVWSWRQSSDGIMFLPDLEKIVWPKRHVFLVFDSDYRTNHHVCAALKELAQALAMRGAIPWITSLPDVVKDGKTGLDDFLIECGGHELSQLFMESQPLTCAESLWMLSEEVVYVKDPGVVVVRKDRRVMSPTAFSSHSYANRIAPRRTLTLNGEVKIDEGPIAEEWLKWPLRAEASG